MAKLSVNINKVATIRNARGGNTPDLLRFATDCERFGAQGITVHPRPDERHIRFNDLLPLRQNIKTELNIEGYPSEHFIDLVLQIKPHQVTLVPDAPDAITSNAGWDTQKNENFLKDVIDKFKIAGIRTSIFIDTEPMNMVFALKTGTDCVELYTESYASNFQKNKEKAIEPYIKAAEMAHSLGLKINAGHDLNLDNLKYFSSQIKHLEEVSIGHALISDALYFGIENTIQMYLKQLN
ncbi:MAG TPA: pyridoxine 5'-phosphate synthase [Bacteroidia bacterium]|nr:pyridoxine 5'-phosphate synthase [Bacteroidia bacterium]